ncbi:MAG: DUF4398 domain-containing protein [Gammaproteobacteria bacterium]|nr:DUF4398 domain-containing protein [Gammaproteobacteria bacterium]MDP2141726.1 DUF4398 domain-containing protein [Gammaproteobacteria bacterium]MDP2347961.1 DUF4398 domain-containing protein [Gammaproteobacteria bacterium]
MIKSEKKVYRQSLVSRLFIGGSLILVLAACASAPLPPTQELQAAELAISSAERERVADHAPQDLKQAHDKLSAARVAVQEEDMVLAMQLAHESRVSAELASAKAAEMKAKAVNDEMRQSITVLEQEIMRNTGARQ